MIINKMPETKKDSRGQGAKDSSEGNNIYKFYCHLDPRTLKPSDPVIL